MTAAKALLKLTLMVLGLTVSFPGFAESPEQLQNRLDQYRQLDAEAVRQQAQQDADAKQRRVQTREWLERRRREEYGRRWKCYGDEEVDVLLWRKQKVGAWVTFAKPASGLIDCAGSAKLPAVVLFGDSLVKIAQRYNLTIAELLRLNPGLEASWLVVGTPIRLSEPGSDRSPIIFNSKPTAAHGLSFSAQPGESIPLQRRFEQSLDELVRQGVVSPWEKGLLLLGEKLPHYSGDRLIGVDCSSLMLNRKPANEGWRDWVRPEPGRPDELLMIDRCTITKP